MLVNRFPLLAAVLLCVCVCVVFNTRMFAVLPSKRFDINPLNGCWPPFLFLYTCPTVEKPYTYSHPRFLCSFGLH